MTCRRVTIRAKSISSSLLNAQKGNKIWQFFSLFIFCGYIFLLKDFLTGREILCPPLFHSDVSQTNQEDPYLIEFIKENILKYSLHKRYNLTQPFKRDSSQFAQGAYLENYFNKKKYGTFIEVGASDGEEFSNTLILERIHKWTGLLIEPNPLSFKSLFNKGRKAQLAECCLSTTQTPTNIYLSLEGPLSHTYNSSANETGLRYTDVNCYPLYSLLVASNLTTLDLLVLDLEGVEVKVLQSLPWNKIDIKTLMIEYNHIPEGEEYLKIFMAERNYYLYNDLGIDYFFVKKS